MTDFERKLRGQPFRQMPSAWRDEIAPREQSVISPTESNWRDWLWPAPQAWAGLAALWLLLALAKTFAPQGAPAVPIDLAGRQSVPVASLYAFQPHDRFVAELSLPE